MKQVISHTYGLAPSNQYAYRRLYFNPIPRTKDSDLIGIIDIEERRTEFSKPVKSRYAVQEYRHEDTRAFKRSFRLVKPGGQEFYNVGLTYIAGGETCDCIGFTQHGHCKHTEVMRILLHNRCLPQPA